jgi:hypothetical protein
MPELNAKHSLPDNPSCHEHTLIARSDKTEVEIAATWSGPQDRLS